MTMMAVIAMIVLAPISLAAAYRISAWARRLNGFFSKLVLVILAIIGGAAAYFFGFVLFSMMASATGLLTMPDEATQFGAAFGHSFKWVFLSIIGVALRGIGIGVSPKKAAATSAMSGNVGGALIGSVSGPYVVRYATQASAHS